MILNYNYYPFEESKNEELTAHINHLEESTKTALNFMKCIALQAKAEIKQNRAELTTLYKRFGEKTVRAVKIFL